MTTLGKKVSEQKELIKKYEEYACGCWKKFEVLSGRIDGMNWLCYEHGMGIKKPRRKVK